MRTLDLTSFTLDDLASKDSIRSRSMLARCTQKEGEMKMDLKDEF
jgi:hypothetical protein